MIPAAIARITNLLSEMETVVVKLEIAISLKVFQFSVDAKQIALLACWRSFSVNDLSFKVTL